MANNSGGLSKAAIAVLVVGVLLLLGSCSGGGVGKALVWGAVLCGAALLALSIIIACVAVKKSGEEAKKGGASSVQHGGTSTSARMGTTTGMRTSERVGGGLAAAPELKLARQTITEEKLFAGRIENAEVRASAARVLEAAGKVVDTLGAKQKKIATSQQFLNYYLPTLGVILKKFRTLEESNMTTPEMQANVVKYLADIEQVMNKQYESLFNDDILDLAVEMEAMTIACKRDGLLSDEDFAAAADGQAIKLEF